jgi:hypothetical protein
MTYTYSLMAQAEADLKLAIEQMLVNLREMTQKTV